MADDNTVKIHYDAPADQTIFVDGASGLRVRNGVCRFNLFQEVFDSTPAGGELRLKLIVACRIAMPLDDFYSLADWMINAKADLQEQLGAKQPDASNTD